jgi:hypothetical protein
MTSTARALRLLLLVPLFALGCAHGGIGSASGWSVVRSKHFTVYALYPRETKLLVRDLETTYSSLGSTFFKNVNLPQVDVLAFSPEVFEEVLGFHRDAVAVGELPGGGIGKAGLLITKDDKGHPGVTEPLAHLFIHKSFAGAPLWFHEGFAAYLRTVQYRYGPGGQMACFGVLPGEKAPVLPMQKMLAVSWDDYDGDQARSWYRNTTRLLIDYILHGADGKNSGRMRPLIEAVGQGKPAQASLEAAFPNVALETLDRKLSEHAADVVYQLESASPRRGLCPLPAAIAADRAASDDRPQVTEAPAAAMASLFQAVLKLPRRNGYPPWYPPEVVARGK